MREVFIVGAGPAGSLAAILLARAGLSVTLLERARFPRDKVCGECISALGWSVLLRANLTDALVNAGAIQLTHAALHPPVGRPMQVQLPSPMFGLSRRVMDSVLLDIARHDGVVVRQPARVESVEPGPRPRLTFRDLVTNAVHSLDADVILLADGKASPAKSTGQFGIKAHFRNVDLPQTGIDLFGFRGGYGGLAPIEGNRWNIAISVKGSRLKEVGGDSEKLFQQFLAENAAFARAMSNAKRECDWLASPLPRSPVASAWRENEIPVGNAAASLEPIGGEGMGLAMRSAELAGAAVLSAVREARATDVRRLRSDYRRLWNTRRVACRSVGALMSSPAAARTIVALAQWLPGSRRAALSLMGKTATRPSTNVGAIA